MGPGPRWREAVSATAFQRHARQQSPSATFTYAVQALNRFSLGYLHIIEMGKETPRSTGPDFDLGILREIWQDVYITNGGYDKGRANAAIVSGTADAIAFGTLFLANPDLMPRFRLDALLNETDPATFYGGDAHGYTDYPPLDEI